MKTQTKARLLLMLTKASGLRPHDLVERLGLSPQAIHRHLKTLLEEGVIERRGRGPQTRYWPADVPNLEQGFQWCVAKNPKASTEHVCETRDVFLGRLHRVYAAASKAISQEESALLVAVAGEVGSNCFDHNLGKWHDVPGCWFQVEITARCVWVFIGDRGQGVFRSLSPASQDITDDQTALNAAFERTLSGRAPENRGNGLKFVARVIRSGADRGIACRSGKGLFLAGALGEACRGILSKARSNPLGTMTLVCWRKS